jgi:Fuc2NAc and GlcNAc transferase
MNPVAALGLAVVALVASWCITGRIRRWALARQLLDIPNARSSHVVATPRAGGLAIVSVTLAGLLIAGVSGWMGWPPIVGLVGSGILVAAVGFSDDRRHVPRRWRLLTHGLAAAWVTTWSGGVPAVTPFGTTFDLGWASLPLGMIYVVWLINLTNFMDGIDGITGIEVVTTCLGSVVLISFLGMGGAGVWLPPMLLAAATTGFLVWNWPPAKIFLGDSGSGFLGLTLAALALQAGQTSPLLFWCWNILLGVFIIDATVTLLHRTVRGDRIHEAHRTHAYQHAAQRWRRHTPVTLAVLLINALWLFPMAALVAANVLGEVTGLLIAYVPLAGAALWLGAGRPAMPGPAHARTHV